MSKSLKISLICLAVIAIAALVAWYWRAHNSGEAPMSPQQRQIINSLSAPTDSAATTSATTKELQSLSVPTQKSPAAVNQENDILKTLQAK